MPASRTNTKLETYSGQYVDLVMPKPETIHLEDIAVGLSNTCRYGGQVTKFYSVAEHAVRVSWYVEENYPAGCAVILAALHHDSHEAYMGDVISPLKVVLKNELKQLEWSLDSAISKSLGINFPARSTKAYAWIKAADEALLYQEAAALKWSHGVGPHWSNDVARQPLAGLGWAPDRAERLFITRHKELSNGTTTHGQADARAA